MARHRLPLETVSRVLGAFRWVFMPVGLVAVVALGVHAAADLVDDRLLWGLVQLDGAFDSLVGGFELTRGVVDAIGLRECTVLARALALVWELAVDVSLGLPLLGYAEKKVAVRGLVSPLGPPPVTVANVLRRLNEKPTPLRLARPLVTLVFSLAGAEAVARLCEGTLFVALSRDLLPAGVAQPVARFAALAAALLVLSRFMLTATLRALEHADASTEASAKRRGRVWSLGLVGTVLAVPLAVVAVLAIPLRSLWS